MEDALPLDHELLLTSEAREFLRVSRATFDRLKRKPGFAQPIRLGSRSLRWKRSELLTWAEATRNKTAAA